MESSFGADYLADVLLQFRKLKSLADDALAQVSDEQVFAAVGEGDNSIAVIVKHVSGNLRSRWTDFLSSDGEKPDRDRDSEFGIEVSEDRAALFDRWEAGWRCAFDALASLTPEDLGRTVLIRAEPHSVVKAIDRSLSHSAYHVGQIVFLCKHFRSGQWRCLSVAPGKSEDFNAEMRRKHQS
ncbi:MAG: DUF1572 family protein [Candidatus Eiseniibacteriota bacterium]|nr:MAG: DUF1572 family protein [Candidatus Eisenbacteria bacterium]